MPEPIIPGASPPAAAPPGGSPQPPAGASASPPAGAPPAAGGAPQNPSTPTPAPAATGTPVPDPAKVGGQQPPTGTTSVVPTKYELKIPDGSGLDPAFSESLSSFAKDKGLSNEQAQAVLERESKLLTDDRQAQLQAMETDYQKKVDGWKEQNKNDKDIGLTAFNESAAKADKALEFLFDPETRKALTSQHVISMPGIFKGLVKLGGAMANDKLVTSQQRPINAPKSDAELFYPSQAKPAEAGS